MPLNQRRDLHFDTLAQILNDARAMVSQPHQTLGKWSAGEICDHLARTMDVMLDGSEMKTPFMLRIAGRISRNYFLSRPMKPGFKVPHWATKSMYPADVTDSEGLAHLESSISRLQSTKQLDPHPIFGKLAPDDAVRLHCRHAELHLSHIVAA